jgi:hypothetical protein
LLDSSEDAAECKIIRNENFVGMQKSADQPDFKAWEGGFIPYLVDIQFGKRHF